MEVEHFTDWASEAREDGYDDGTVNSKAEDIVSVMRDYGCSIDQAMKTIRVPDGLKDEVLRKVKELQTTS